MEMVEAEEIMIEAIAGYEDLVLSFAMVEGTGGERRRLARVDGCWRPKAF
jgi:hypothetical protein